MMQQLEVSDQNNQESQSLQFKYLKQYNELKESYDQQKFVIKGLEMERKGDESKGKDKIKYYEEALFYFRKGQLPKNDEKRKRIESKLK